MSSATLKMQPGPMSDAGVSQLGNYTGLQNAVFGLNALFLILALVSLGLRFWSRRIKRMSIMINDVFATIALVFLLGFFALISYGLCTGMGRHPEGLSNPQKQVPFLLKLMVPLPILWSSINTLVKISVLDLYLRVFPVKRLRLAAYSLIGIASSYWVIALLFAFLNCRPFSYTWDRSGGQDSGKCVDNQGGTLGFGVVNLILDIAVIILPMPYLYTLQLRLSKRVSLIAIFALGFVITAISAVRINAIVTSKSFSYGTAKIALWSFLETSLSIINCCLPTIQPALLVLWGHLARPFAFLATRKEVDETSTAEKFITLTASTTNSSPAQSRGASPDLGHRAEARYVTIKRGDVFVTAQAPPKQSNRKWETSYYEEKTQIDPEEYSVESQEETNRHHTKDLPPLPTGSDRV